MYTLLIADDEKLERDAIGHIISKSPLSFTIHKVKNGREAAQRIKEISQHTIIIFLSALNTFDFAQEAIRAGARDYLVKPVSSHELLSLLTKLIEEVDVEKSKAPPEQLKTMLTLFNRSFFAAIKYGNISYDAMKSYFSLENIIYEQGISLIFNTSEEKELLPYLQNLISTKGFGACYFPSIDRISVILFAHNPNTLKYYIEQDITNNYATHCFVGISQIFFNLESIPTSITEASHAYSVALHQRRSLVIYTPELKTITASFYEKRNELETLLYSTVLEGKLEQSRQTMHEIQEALTTHLSGEELINALYETILVFSRSISNEIPHLSYSPLQKTSLLELERYVMDFIDYACMTMRANKKDKYQAIFQQVCSYIDNNYHQVLTLELLAQKYQLSPSYFSRLFTEYCGTSFISYLTQVRIEAAKKHILIGTKIHEVAHIVGYTDYSYFSRVFRQSVGVSPKTYQMNNTKREN
jgi:two-component system response regulator YesN